MIFALLFAASGAAGPSEWCDSLAIVAQASAEAKAHGIPLAKVEEAAQRLPTPEARLAAHAIAAIAYSRDKDDKLPPEEFARRVRETCLHPEPSDK